MFGEEAQNYKINLFLELNSLNGFIQKNKSIWLPAIGDVIKAVDVEKGEIIVTLLPGLREVYETSGEGEEDCD